jgi:pyruvate dehydrogenase E1 component beta subunit
MTKMDYKGSLAWVMSEFADDPKARFVGYGLLGGRGANGTMKTIPNEKIIETTVAEGMMAGMAQGLAMMGLRPLLYLERSDFLLNAADAIVNHLDKCRQISHGVFNPTVVIRVTVGNSKKPLFTGPTHTQNFSNAFRHMLHMPVYEVRTPDEVLAAYERAFKEQREGIGSSMIFDFKDLL